MASRAHRRTVRSTLLPWAFIMVVGCSSSSRLGPTDLSTIDTCVYPAHFGDNLDDEVEFKTLDALPSRIRSALDDHLLGRLGSAFLARLRFKEAAFLDPARVPKEAQSLRELGRDYVAYVVLFDLHLQDGVDYCAGVHLTVDGRVAMGVGLPHISRAPAKATVIPSSDAVAVAVRNGLSQATWDTRLRYSPSLDALVWEISEVSGHEANRAKVTTCHVNAHTGGFIGWSSGNVLFD